MISCGSEFHSPFLLYHLCSRVSTPSPISLPWKAIKILLKNPVTFTVVYEQILIDHSLWIFFSSKSHGGLHLLLLSLLKLPFPLASQSPRVSSKYKLLPRPSLMQKEHAYHPVLKHLCSFQDLVQSWFTGFPGFILTTDIGKYCCPSSADGNWDKKRFKDMPKVIQQVCNRGKNRTNISWISVQSLSPSPLCF